MASLNQGTNTRNKRCPVREGTHTESALTQSRRDSLPELFLICTKKKFFPSSKKVMCCGFSCGVLSAQDYLRPWSCTPDASRVASLCSTIYLQSDAAKDASSVKRNVFPHKSTQHDVFFRVQQVSSNSTRISTKEYPVNLKLEPNN